MNSIIQNLNKYGAVTDGDFHSKIESDDLYISSLDAFALDDRFDKLHTQAAARDFSGAAVTAHSLLGSVRDLNLKPLEDAARPLCDALEQGSPEAIDSALAAFDVKYVEFKRALSCG
ncbi:MAG: hypothetical protein ACI4JF_00625 [Oscillospiraceae bacterium]